VTDRATPHHAGPWALAQTWHDLLFAHWPVDAGVLCAQLPRGLELDTFAGRAWIGVVPFRMSGVRVRGTPALPWLSAFPELNLRTYVVHGGRAGVWFFALEASRLIAVHTARRWFRLPYFHARMSCAAAGLEIEYASERIHRGAPAAGFRARYGPIAPVERARAGTLEHWLTERYCLFAADGDGTLLRGDVEHEPWPLQRAAARIEHCTLPAAHGIALPDVAPHLLFARRVDVRAWAPVRA
jgi:uncharacterized protein YqjF (DUF2071 family)